MNVICDAIVQVAIPVGLALCSGRYMLGVKRILDSHRFYNNAEECAQTACHNNVKAVIVVPAMMEQQSIGDAISFFCAIGMECDCVVVFVTTEKERVLSGRRESTKRIVERLASNHEFVHVHCPDVSGTKADQINHVVSEFQENVGPEAERVWIIYDIDSRPTFRAVKQLIGAILSHPHHNVFQQCSRFVNRSRTSAEGVLSAALRRCATLRANRFVYLYELPRIRRRLCMDPTDVVAACTYAHVTGHGLAIRDSYLRRYPFPAHTIMEDMFYGFLLNSRGEAVIPVPSVDEAEVPNGLREDFLQAARWFAGPARGVLYCVHPRCRRSIATLGILCHSVLITCEWLAQGVAIPVMAILLWYGSSTAKLLLGVYFVTYSMTVGVTYVLVTERRVSWQQALVTACAYPVCVTVFGLAGWWGLVRLLTSPETLNCKTTHVVNEGVS